MGTHYSLEYDLDEYVVWTTPDSTYATHLLTSRSLNLSAVGLKTVSISIALCQQPDSRQNQSTLLE